MTASLLSTPVASLSPPASQPGSRVDGAAAGQAAITAEGGESATFSLLFDAQFALPSEEGLSDEMLAVDGESVDELNEISELLAEGEVTDDAVEPLDLAAAGHADRGGAPSPGAAAGANNAVPPTAAVSIAASPVAAQSSSALPSAASLTTASPTAAISDGTSATASNPLPTTVDLPPAGKPLPTEPLPSVRMPPTPAPETGASHDIAAALIEAQPAGVELKLVDALAKATVGQRAESANASSTTTGAGSLAWSPAMASTEKTATRRSDEAVPGLPVRSPHFASLLGNQVMWQAKVGNQHAEIRLDPPELGPIEVRISQRDSETHLQFTVSHSVTRDQLEQALPRLRELFGQGGLQLGDVQVQHGEPERHSDDAAEQSTGGKRAAELASGDASTPLRQLSNNLIDAYA